MKKSRARRLSVAAGMLALALAGAAFTAAAQPQGQKGYEGQPGNQSSSNSNGANGQQGYEGQPGNQGGGKHNP